MTEPHFLYRLRDRAGRLMYVGITRDVSKRMNEHCWEKHWWSAVDKVETEEHPDRPAVQAAERRALVEERPALNVMHTADWATWKDAGLGLTRIGVDPENWTAALRIAHVRGESLNDVLRDAVTRYVDEHKGVLDDAA